MVDGSGEQVTCPTKMSSIEQLIVIYLDNRSVFHKDNFFFSLDFFVLFYENRFHMPLHNWILQNCRRHLLSSLWKLDQMTNVVSLDLSSTPDSITKLWNMNFQELYDQLEQHLQICYILFCFVLFFVIVLSQKFNSANCSRHLLWSLWKLDQMLLWRNRIQ